MILHLHRAGHGTYTRQNKHGISFRVIAKWMRLAGVDHIHAGTVVGKLEGDPLTMQGYYDVCREDHNPLLLERGIFFDQPWASLNKVMPVASGGIHAGQMHQLLKLFGDDCCCSLAAAPLVIRAASRLARRPTASRSRRWSWRATKGATCARRAEHPGGGRQACTPLSQALDTWRDVTFNYASTDPLDFVATPTVS